MDLVGQTAAIVLPPIWKYKGPYGINAVANTEILPADINKVYIINQILLNCTNDGTTAGTYLAVEYTDYWSGEVTNIALGITPSAVANETLIMTGMNIPCMPGTVIKAVSDNALLSWNSKVWFTEVQI